MSDDIGHAFERGSEEDVDNLKRDDPLLTFHLHLEEYGPAWKEVIGG